MLSAISRCCGHWAGEAQADNEQETMVGNRGGAIGYQSINMPAIEAAGNIELADNESWLNNCHRRVVSFFTGCSSGGRNCLNYFIKCKNPLRSDYVCSPASLMGIGMCSILGGVLFSAMEYLHESGNVSKAEYISAIFPGTFAGGVVGFFVVGPLFYQLRVGSYSGLCDIEDRIA